MSLGRAVDRILGYVTWAKVTASKAAAGAIGLAWVKAHSVMQLQHLQPYGVQSRPKPGADAVVVAMGSSASQRVVLMAVDRRWNIELAEGEVAIVDDQGQRVHLKRTGIVVDAPSIQLGAGAVAGVVTEGATFSVSGTITGGGAFTGTGTITGGGSSVVKAVP